MVAPSARPDEEGFFAPTRDSRSIEAELVEDRSFKAIPLPAVNETGFTHFLDGAQKTLRCGYLGMNPIFLAHTSAAILERRDREVLPPEPHLYDGSLELFSVEPMAVPEGIGLRCLGTREEETGLGAEERLHDEISNRREDRETGVTSRFRGGTLLVDGGIGKMLGEGREDLVGMVKSHQRQYFQSAERIEVIRNLREGERTTVFRRPSVHHKDAEAYSFYLRLHARPDQGPLFGLVRIELAPTAGSVDRADEIAGWILHERAPLSLPDARYDRMLYPIRLVEKHLKARQPSEAALRAIVGV